MPRRATGRGKYSFDIDEVALAYALNKVALHAKSEWIARHDRQSTRKHPVETTVASVVNKSCRELRYVNDGWTKAAARPGRTDIKNWLQCHGQAGRRRQEHRL